MKTEETKSLQNILPPMSDKDFKTMEASFEGGKYEKVIISEPMILYRYFGSVPDGEGVPEEKINDTINDIKINKIEFDTGWGSDAGGQYLTRDGNLTSDKAREMLALNPDWGNSILYKATIEVPAGTEIFIGIAKEQESKVKNGEKVSGGGEQIVLNGYWTTDMNSWIKECNVVNSNIEPTNYVGVDIWNTLEDDGSDEEIIDDNQLEDDGCDMEFVEASFDNDEKIR